MNKCSLCKHWNQNHDLFKKGVFKNNKYIQLGVCDKVMRPDLGEPFFFPFNKTDDDFFSGKTDELKSILITSSEFSCNLFKK